MKLYNAYRIPGMLFTFWWSKGLATTLLVRWDLPPEIIIIWWYQNLNTTSRVDAYKPQQRRTERPDHENLHATNSQVQQRWSGRYSNTVQCCCCPHQLIWKNNENLRQGHIVICAQRHDMAPVFINNSEGNQNTAQKDRQKGCKIHGIVVSKSLLLKRSQRVIPSRLRFRYISFFSHLPVCCLVRKLFSLRLLHHHQYNQMENHPAFMDILWQPNKPSYDVARSNTPPGWSVPRCLRYRNNEDTCCATQSPFLRRGG